MVVTSLDLTAANLKFAWDRGKVKKPDMRRAVASLVIALISFPLIAAALRADERATLKACCLRDGKHHCEMVGEMVGEMAGEMAEMGSADNGPSLRPQKCASWPTQAIAVVGAQAVAAPHADAIESPIRAYSTVVRSSLVPVGEVRASALRKRGPPVSLD